MKTKIITLLTLTLTWLAAATPADDDIAAGRNYLAAHDVWNANVQFANAVAAAPTNATANLLAAVTRLLVLPQTPVGSNFLNSLAITNGSRDIYNWTATLPEDTNGSSIWPANFNSATGIAFYRNTVMAALAASATNLANIKDPAYTLTLLAAETTHGEDVTLDYGDIQLMRALVAAGQFAGYTINAQNASVIIPALQAMSKNNGLTIQAVLAAYPSLLTLSSAADLASSKVALTNGIALYFASSDFIRNVRAPGVVRLFNLDTNDLVKEADFHTQLTNVLLSLNGPVQFDASQSFSINASNYFSGTKTLRSFLPRFIGDTYVYDSLPDYTFGGILLNEPAFKTENALRKGFYSYAGIYAGQVDDLTVGDYSAGNFAVFIGTNQQATVVGYNADSVNSSSYTQSGGIYVQFTIDQHGNWQFENKNVSGNGWVGKDGSFGGELDFTNGDSVQLYNGYQLSPVGSFQNAAGYYTGTASGVSGSGTLSIVLSADGQLIFRETDTSGIYSDGGTAQLDSNKHFTTVSVGGTTVSGTLNSSTFQFTGTFISPGGDRGAFSMTRTASILLDIPPVITVPPTNRIVEAGSNVTFSVTATGSSPLCYQWFCNGVPLIGSTSNSLVLSNVSLAINQNQYAVTVQNVVGATNASALLTVGDVTRPGVLITNLVSGQRWSNNVFTVMGTASDNVAVSNVMYDFNNRGNWQVATGSNHWAAALPLLTERSNTVAVYAVDTAGNYSPTSRVSFLYILSDTLTVVTNGRGSVSPNDNNARLEIGQGYTLTATAAAGFAFTNWTGTAFGVPVLSTNKAALTFIMQSNLTLTATFVDVTRPGVLITNLVSGQRWSNNVFTVMGTASDNVAVSNVMYDFNNRGNWQVATGSNHWAAALPLLTERSNTVAVYAVDTAGNYSPTSRVSFLYILSDTLTVVTNGRGSVSPNDNNARLEIGQGYTLTATAAAGFAFTNWTGTAFGVPVLSTNKAALTFIMQSNLTLTATFVDVTRPGVLITNLVSGQRWSNNVFTVMGTASDNVAVSNVMYDFNNRGNWQVATGSNHWAAALPPLTERSNTVAVYAVDTAGNYSPTSRVSFLYILSDTLTVVTNGRGSVSPNDNNARLEIGQGYTLTATAAAGFAFTNWTGTAFGVPVLSTNKAALTFIMQSNLTLTATFVDVTRPGVLITNLVSGQRWSNNVFTVMGTASDNVAVSNVMYDFNNRGNWQVATGSNHWAAALPLLTERSNTVAVYAVDTAGNYSPTSRVSFLYILSDTLTVVTNGRGSVSPNDNNARLEIGQGYTLTATAAAGFAFTNWTGTAFGVPVLSTNKAALTFIMQSNLTLTATFVDVTRPGVLITNLVSGQRWSNNVFTVMGTASDNVAVSNVMYDFNNRGNWQVATGSNHWAAALPLLTERSNTVAVYAVDTAGNYSPTSRVSFLYIAPPSLVGIWNMVQFQTPAQITFDVNNGLQGGGNFAVTNGTMTINGDGSLSGHLGADFTGTYTTGIDGTVTANLTTSDGTEVHTFYVNNRKDTLTTADSLNDANNNQQEIVVAHRGPVTVVAADIAGVWNLVQFKTPALITNDINTSLRGGDSFETTNGSLTLNANGTFSGHLNNPITGTFNIGGNGIINLLSSSGTHTFYLNADEDTMTLVDSMYGPNDNQQEMVVAQRVPASVAVADLAGTWNLTQFQTPAAITNDLSNGVQGGGNFEVVNGSMTVSANGAVSGNLTGAFTGTLTIGASGAITLHITSGGNETHTFYVNAGKNTLILTDRQLDSNNNQQETVVAQRVPAN